MHDNMMHIAHQFYANDRSYVDESAHREAASTIINNKDAIIIDMGNKGSEFVGRYIMIIYFTYIFIEQL